ncbi:MAG: PEGA domain-containing protein [Bacteroidetes bacterium]|nr:PEGA domain-containing protein [Bacteroidota bacterium]
MLSRYLLLSAVLIVGVAADAQDRTMLIETNQPDALVFADSLLLGRAGAHAFKVDRGVQAVYVRPEQAASWSILPLEFDVASTDSDTLEFVADFPYYYSLRTVPPGAGVRIDGIEVGSTPLVIARPDPVADSLVVRLDGFEPVGLEPGSRLWNHYDIDLIRSSRHDVAAFRTIAPEKRRRWIDIAAIGVAAAGGAVAVHYKFKADRRYALYEETGDPALRPGIKTLDVKSGIALGAMQAGITVFAVRLIRR